MSQTNGDDFLVGIPGTHLEPDDFPVEKSVEQKTGHVFSVRVFSVLITLLIAFGALSVVGLAVAMIWAIFYNPDLLFIMAILMFSLFYTASLFYD